MSGSVISAMTRIVPPHKGHRAVAESAARPNIKDAPHFYRVTLHLMFQRLLDMKDDVDVLTRQSEQLVNKNEYCKRLLAIGGVGPIGAVLLYATLGSGEAFQSGREFCAYLGLTPKHYSSGGKTKLVGISRHIANKRLRAVLIQGVRAYTNHVSDP
jgi:transposase